jgi:hypothetical protein
MEGEVGAGEYWIAIIVNLHEVAKVAHGQITCPALVLSTSKGAKSKGQVDWKLALICFSNKFLNPYSNSHGDQS